MNRLTSILLLACTTAACGTTKQGPGPATGGGMDAAISGSGGTAGSDGTGGGGGAAVDAEVERIAVVVDAARDLIVVPPPNDAALPPADAGVTVAVHIAGDSTAAIFPATDPTMRVGWGAVLQPLFTSSVRVNDAARSGRSSKSFIDEGAWAALKAQIRPGDYVLIQFAHNDEKLEDPLRYTDPATTFRDNLRTFIADTRNAGGVAVLLTPIARRQFAGTTVSQTHGNYPAAVIAVGQETTTPVIDMTDKTRVWLEGLGPIASIPMFAVSDNTHLSAQGAPMVAKLVTDGIRELGLPLADRLAPAP